MIPSEPLVGPPRASKGFTWIFEMSDLDQLEINGRGCFDLRETLVGESGVNTDTPPQTQTASILRS